MDGFTAALRDVTLVFGNAEVNDGGQLTVNMQSFLTRNGALEFASDDENFEQWKKDLRSSAKAIGIATNALQLVVTASTPRLKMTDVVLQHPLSKLATLRRRHPLTEPERPRAFRAPNGGCRVDVYICLSASLKRQALKPWRYGTWLGHARFSLSTDLGGFGFVPRALTDELRLELHLPPQTVRYLHVDEDALYEPATDETIEMWVDEAVLTAITRNPKTPGARLFQRQLFIDAIGAATHAYSRSLTADPLGVDDLADCLLGKILDLVAGHAPGETSEQRRTRLDSLLSDVLHRPQRFIAVAEQACGYRKDIEEVLGT